MQRTIMMTLESTISADVAEDISHEIRPGGDGRPFWNGNAIMFMYPPAFEFRAISNAPSYRFNVVDALGKMHVFRAPTPYASLKPIWDKLPAGFTTVTCNGELNNIPNTSVMAGTRAFWKSAPFTGIYPSPKRSHAIAAKMALDYAINAPSAKYLLEHGEPDPSFKLNVYPSKMLSAVARVACTVAESETDAVRHSEAILLARRALDWLITHAEKDDAPLPHFPPTYNGTFAAAGKYAGQVMLIYPAEAALAYLRFYELTNEKPYLAEAEAVAATYLKLQGNDGTWPLKLNLKDGSQVRPNRLVPIAGMIPLMEKLADITGKTIYRDSATKAFANLERTRIEPWNWEGQFEDVPPNDSYVNLTKHDACSTAIYLANRFSKDETRLALARDLLRFAEDQFVCWEKPFNGMDLPPNTSMLDLNKWVCPGVLEQYWWYNPIDASAAKLIRTYLALYRAEGKALDLAKAKALGDSLTRVQWDSGCFPTQWALDEVPEGIWMNCHIASALALEELARVEEAETKSAVAPCVSTVSEKLKDTVIVVGGHPDDLVGSAGLCFLLQDKVNLHLIDFTRGARGPDKSANESPLAKRRMAEEREACGMLGMTPHFMEEVNGIAFAGNEACEYLAAKFTELKPRAVILHWPIDLHTDHIMSSAAALKALEMAKMMEKVEIIFFEETWQSKNFPVQRLVDITSVWDKKVELIRKYECQNVNDGIVQNKYRDGKFRGSQLWPTEDGRVAEAYSLFQVPRQGTKSIFDEYLFEPGPIVKPVE